MAMARGEMKCHFVCENKLTQLSERLDSKTRHSDSGHYTGLMSLLALGWTCRQQNHHNPDFLLIQFKGCIGHVAAGAHLGPCEGPKRRNNEMLRKG